MHLSNIDLKAGRTTASGTVGFEEREGARPHVAADLKISGLNVAELPLGADVRAGRGSRSAVPAPSPLSLDGPGLSAAARRSRTRSRTCSNRPGGPQVKGYTQRAGWSTEPIDIKALGLADVDARVALTDVTYGRTRIDGAQVSVGVKDQVAKVTLAELRLYNGSGHGFVTLDASCERARVHRRRFAVGHRGAAAAARFRAGRLAGRQRRRGLEGIGPRRHRGGDGAIAERHLERGRERRGGHRLRSRRCHATSCRKAVSRTSPSDPAKKTDFRRLNGTFVIANGIATNNDLKLDSQHLHASGAGTVDLPQRSLDYTVRPKLVANLGGDGGEANAAGIEVPVHITGSWEKPDISPDIEGAINAPGTIDAVKQIGKQLKGKNAGEVVQDLFGESKDGGPSKAQKLLDNLFGKD